MAMKNKNLINAANLNFKICLTSKLCKCTPHNWFLVENLKKDEDDMQICCLLLYPPTYALSISSPFAHSDLTLLEIIFMNFWKHVGRR